MDWLTAHWEQLTAVAAAIVGLARLIVKMLPNPEADTKLEKVVDALKHVGLSVPPISTAPVPTNPEPPKPTAERPPTSPKPEIPRP